MEAPAPAQPSLVTTTLLVVAIVFPILGTIAVGLRFYTKVVKKQKPSSDDWVCALAQLVAWGISIDIFVAAGVAGVETVDPSVQPLDAAVIFLRVLWIEGFPLAVSLTLVKIAILLFYGRIFTTFKFKLAIHIFIGILTAWCIAVVIAQLLAADPIDAVWNPLAVDPLRYNYNEFSLAFAGMSMVFDIIVLCFPLPVIRKLQMSWTRRVQVLAIFWLGIFCCISSAVRFYYLYIEINRTTAAAPSEAYLNITTAFVWATIEPSTSVVAACLPCYAPLFAKGRSLPTLLSNFGSLFSSRGSRSKAKNGSDLLESGGSYQLQKPKQSVSAWERYDRSMPSYNVDVERANSFQGDGDQVPLGDARITVARDFLTTESREALHGYDRS